MMPGAHGNNSRHLSKVLTQALKVTEMKRREFLGTVAATGVAAGTNLNDLFGADATHAGHQHADCHPTYATIQDAIASPRETFAFVPAITVRYHIEAPDYMATVDVDPDSQ